MVSGTALVVKAVVFLGLGIAATANTRLAPVADEVEAAFNGMTASSENGCGDQAAACMESSLCISCIESEFGDDTDSGDDDTVFSCSAVDTYLCETYGTNSTCNDNTEYEEYVECMFGAFIPECAVDLCGSAMGLTQYSGAAVFSSAAVAGLLAVALGTAL